MDPRFKKSIDKYLSKNKLEQISTPSIIFDLEILRNNYEIIKKEIANGNCSIRYAMKVNSEEKVIEKLKSLGCGFEIASIYELNKLKKLGVKPNKIQFSNPVKLPLHIKAAFDYGVKNFAYDSFEELEKLVKYAPGANVFLRIDVGNIGSTQRLDIKFGAHKKDWVKLLLKAKELNLNPMGVTFLVGWNNTSLTTWKNAVITAQNLIKIVIKKGINIKMLNIGGGFPAHLIDQISFLKSMCMEINPILNKLIKDHSLEIFAEPGSFLSNNCGALLTKVYAKLKRKNGNWLFVDASMMGGFYEILVGTKYGVYLPSNTNLLLYNTKYTITGTTCDGFDVFFKNIKLPKTISVGDLLIIYPAGAYITARKKYNGFPYPKTEFIK